MSQFHEEDDNSMFQQASRDRQRRNSNRRPVCGRKRLGNTLSDSEIQQRSGRNRCNSCNERSNDSSNY